MELMKLEHVSKYVLRDVSMNIASYGAYALVGPNGSGKTTILKLFAGILCPEKGIVRVLDRDPYRDYLVRSLVNYVAVRPLSELSERVASYLKLHEALTPPRLRWHSVSSALETLGVKELANRRLYELSEGQRRKVELAKLLIRRAPVNLVDEPTELLDRESRELVTSILRDLSRDSVVLIASHDIELLKSLDPYTYLIDGGRIVREGKGLGGFGESMVFELEAVVKSRGLEPIERLGKLEGVESFRYSIDVEPILRALGVSSSIAVMQFESVEEARARLPTATFVTLRGVELSCSVRARVRSLEALVKLVSELAKSCRVKEIRVRSVERSYGSKQDRWS